MSTVSEEYRKERRRVLQAVRRAQSSGATVDKSLIPALKKHPTKKDVEALKTIKPSTLKRVTPSKEKKVETVVPKIAKPNTTKVKKKKTVAGTNISTKKPRVPSPKASKPASPKTHKVSIPKAPKVKTPKAPKPKLTPEQLHDVRVKAGRKAWETRRGKMTDEQYEAFRKQFAEQMKNARDIKKKIASDLAGGEFEFEMPPETVINLDILDLIERAINNLPCPKAVRTRAKMFAFYDWSDEYPLMSAFYDTIMEMGEENAIKYFSDREEELMANLLLSQHDSEQEDLENHLGHALTILVGSRVLTPAESKALSEYEERYGLNGGI